jgi:Holliday junction resolvase RusA-like endonuclease
MTASFFVPGVPISQGSKKLMRTNFGRSVMVESSPQLKPWREAVKYTALRYRAIRSQGAMRVVCTFVFTRPKSHYGTGKNALNLKPSAPASMTTKPDVDKLARAILDALTGTLYSDDSQVVELKVVKRYAALEEPIGVWIEVENVG